MKNNLILFLVGAFLYGLVEVVWRGYSHWSMMIAGGLCFIVFSRISEKLIGLPLLYKCILGSACITLIEFVFGLIFNLYFKLDVWDYSNLPLNFLGQICLLYSVLWGYRRGGYSRRRAVCSSSFARRLPAITPTCR